MDHAENTLTSQDGLRLYAQTWTPTNAPLAVVCLVHGMGEHSGRYGYVAEEMTNAGFALVAMDLRGHGKSQGKRGHSPSYDHLLDDITTLLDHVETRFPGKPRFLYGHSMGGGLVLNYAIRRRPAIAGVVATSPSLMPGFQVPPIKSFLGKVFRLILPAFTMGNGLDRAGLSRDPRVIAAYGRDPLVHDRITARLGIDVIETGKWTLEHATEFPPLPLLLIQGSQDPIVSPPATRQFAGRVPANCTFHLFEGYYHETHNEPGKKEVLSLITRWLIDHLN